MDKLLNLILVILSDVIPSEHRATNTRRVTTAAACAALSAVALIAALGCATAAIWIYLAAAYGPLGGALGCTATLLVVSGALVLVARGQFQDELRTTKGSTSLGEELTKELHKIFLRHKGSALLTALIAGFAAGKGK